MRENNPLGLDVQKYDKVHQAVVTGEANGSFVRKVLKKLIHVMLFGLIRTKIMFQ